MTTPDEALAPIVKRVTARLIPILLLMYVLAFLDRANIGFAKEQFQADTGISNAAYARAPGSSFSVTRCSRCPATWRCADWARRCGLPGS